MARVAEDEVARYGGGGGGCTKGVLLGVLAWRLKRQRWLLARRLSRRGFRLLLKWRKCRQQDEEHAA